MFQVVSAQYQTVYGDTWINAMKENGALLWMCTKYIPWDELPETKELFDESQNTDWQ